MNITLANIEFHIFELPLLVFLIVTLMLNAYKYGLNIRFFSIYSLKLFTIGFFFFFASILTSALFAENPSLIIKALLKWGEVFLLTMLVLFYIRDRSSFFKIYWFLFTILFAYSLISFFLLISGRLADFGFRMPGGYDSLFALSLITPFIKKSSRWLTVLGIITVLNIIFSFSRGAWLGALLLFIYLGVFYFRNHRAKMLVFISAFVLILVSIRSEFLSQLFNWRWTTAFDIENASNIERLGLIQVAFQGFLKSPLFGIGALNFPTYLISTSNLYIMRAEVLETLSPHNFFMEILCELGLFGVFAVFMIFVSVYQALSMKKSCTDNDSMPLYMEGLRLLFFTFLFAVSLGFISGGYRLYMALLFGMALSRSKAGEIS